MSSWYTDKFNGLRTIALTISSDPLMDNLRAYCKYSESGLRKKALEHLREFVADMAKCAVDQKRSIALDVVESWQKHLSVDRFLPYPLKHEFLLPTFDQWLSESPFEVQALHWLGLLTRDPDILERALTVNPRDVDVRSVLVSFRLGFVDYATHHLSETLFIGKVEDSLAALDDAHELLRSAEEKAPFAHLFEELSEFQALLSDWIEYKKSPEGTFPEWCRRRGHAHHWVAAIYYTE